MALSPAIEKAEKIQRLLQDMGLEVSRHASSMLVLAQGLVAASIHVYPEECIVNLYAPWRNKLRAIQDKIVEAVRGLCSRVEARYTPSSGWTPITPRRLDYPGYPRRNTYSEPAL